MRASARSRSRARQRAPGLRRDPDQRHSRRQAPRARAASPSRSGAPKRARSSAAGHGSMLIADDLARGTQVAATAARSDSPSSLPTISSTSRRARNLGARKRIEAPSESGRRSENGALAVDGGDRRRGQHRATASASSPASFAPPPRTSSRGGSAPASSAAPGARDPVVGTQAAARAHRGEPAHAAARHRADRAESPRCRPGRGRRELNTANASVDRGELPARRCLRARLRRSPGPIIPCWSGVRAGTGVVPEERVGHPRRDHEQRNRVGVGGRHSR